MNDDVIDFEHDVPRMQTFFYTACLSKPRSHKIATKLCQLGISWPRLLARKFDEYCIVLRNLGLDKDEVCEIEEALRKDFPDLISVHGRAFDDSPEV